MLSANNLSVYLPEVVAGDIRPTVDGHDGIVLQHNHAKQFVNGGPQSFCLRGILIAIYCQYCNYRILKGHMFGARGRASVNAFPRKPSYCLVITVQEHRKICLQPWVGT